MELVIRSLDSVILVEKHVRTVIGSISPLLVDRVVVSLCKKAQYLFSEYFIAEQIKLQPKVSAPYQYVAPIFISSSSNNAFSLTSHVSYSK
jgi:hypothetical protein